MVGAATRPFIRKLESVADLSGEERSVLAGIDGAVKELAPHTDAVREGDRPSSISLLLNGFMCCYKLVQDGRRQILSFHLPGDIPDLQSLMLRVMDHSIGTLSPCRIAVVPHDSLLALMRRHPDVATLLWRDTLITAAILREWMVGIGRRSAYARIAHVLCELMLRMSAVGLAEDGTCDLPLTQNEFADALGLSTVHVNRTLQELRADGLIRLHSGSLTILDWDELRAVGGFDATYLHLRGGSGDRYPQSHAADRHP
jgi:CRP-like cAMP-binding protein